VTTTPWGPTDVRQHTAWKQRGHDLHVIVRGVDVTNRCRFFDDTSTPPVAELLRKNDQGRPYLDEDRCASVEVAHDFTIVDRGRNA
jgi:hypothetical protein